MRLTLLAATEETLTFQTKELGVVTLRPIQVAYESPKFMLPASNEPPSPGSRPRAGTTCPGRS